ncbi:hypothetical protein [Candidatus Amarolinea dominans]|uniref:hypothetical protein n=1 Tax=Candidatus Amarolinea dominans TaxID=3140696 RepID=UPI0031352973|nr:hypothetical protein [Anaerolineae bacterium]
MITALYFILAALVFCAEALGIWTMRSISSLRPLEAVMRLLLAPGRLVNLANVQHAVGVNIERHFNLGIRAAPAGGRRG